MYFWWSLCPDCTSLVKFMYLVFTRVPGESYRRRLGSLLLCLFRALIRKKYKNLPHRGLEPASVLRSLGCWFIQYLLQKIESSCFHVHPMLWLFDFVVVVFSTSLSAVGNSGRLTCIRHSSCKKSSATHSYQWVRYFPVSRQCYGCHCLGFLTCAQMLNHANAPGIVQTPRSVRTKADSGRRKNKNLAAPGTRTRVSIAPDFSVGRSTSW